MHRSSQHRAIRRPIDRAAVVSVLVRNVAALVLVLACGFATGCGKSQSFLASNTPPTLTLTSGPVDTLSTPQQWIVEIGWTASDPDGGIDHFEYALDPPTRYRAFATHAETAWVSTRASRTTARFHAARPGILRRGTTAAEFHTFALRAIDGRGVASPVVIRAFYANNVAPDVRIVRPLPSALLTAIVPLPFRIEWQGDDPDNQGQGQGQGRLPAAYRIRLLNLNDPNDQIFLSDPDSLLRQGMEKDWRDWQLVAGDTTFHDITAADIIPNQTGAFAVLAVDRAGATTPYLDLSTNFLRFQAAIPGSSAPLIHVFSSYGDYTYPSGGYSTDPSREIPVQIGTGSQPVIHWDAVGAPGRRVVSSRWMLDGDVSDETPRSGPTDLAHWSAPGPAASEAQLPGLTAGVHRLYIEVTDDFGEKSLAIVRIEAILVTPTHELLVVDDTRLEVDKFSGFGGTGGAGTLLTYTQPWPSAAELDTFLYARGGMPWRQTKNPTSGVLSSPGLLAGYPFDTLGTRLGLENPAAGVPLSRLLEYRHVLWLAEPRGATFSAVSDPTLFPMTALRAMSRPGATSALGAYVEAGGRVWLAGGAAAYASLIEFDRRQNNVGQTTVFSVDAGELGPGRPVYDHAHLRSSVDVTVTAGQLARSPAARGGWSGHGPDGSLAAPDYSRLPELRYRTADSDPIPPTRLASQGGLFYRDNAAFEYVASPNVIAERMSPHGNSPKLESTLDTLYQATSPALLTSPAPAMFYYHGRENAPFVFTGFDIWTWTRSDCQALVDFVLGDIWGLAKSGGAARPVLATGAAGTARVVAPVARSTAASPMRR